MTYRTLVSYDSDHEPQTIIVENTFEGDEQAFFKLEGSTAVLVDVLSVYEPELKPIGAYVRGLPFVQAVELKPEGEE